MGVNGGTITDSYASGAVKAAGDVGGLVGQAGATSVIANAYAVGTVTGDTSGAASFVGGLVGQTATGGTITFAYAAGKVTNGSGGSADGGLIGSNAGAVTDAYWDQDRTGLSVATGGNSGALSSVVGLTGTQVFTIADYVGFNPTATPGATGNNWVIVDGDSTLNNNGGAAGVTLPMLAVEAQSTIRNTHQLLLMDMNLSGTYVLGRNIDAAATGTSSGFSTGTDVWGSAGFAPIADNNTGPFSGTFNGGASIFSLTINSTGNLFVGTFGMIGAGAIIRNVAVANSSVTTDSAADATGGLVGFNSGGIISNVSFGGTVTSTSTLGNVGGLVGLMDNAGTIASSQSSGTVTDSGASHIGGLVGRAEALGGAGSITGSSSSATVTGFNNVGGLAGDNEITITNSSASGTVSGGSDVGGLVGINNSLGTASIASSSATGAVSGNSNIGGLVGENTSSSTITTSFARGTTAGVGSGGSVGGFVGSNDTGGIITLSYAAGAVSSTAGLGSEVGGFAGTNSGSIANAYAVGAGTRG